MLAIDLDTEAKQGPLELEQISEIMYQQPSCFIIEEIEVQRG